MNLKKYKGYVTQEEKYVKSMYVFPLKELVCIRTFNIGLSLALLVNGVMVVGSK